MSDSGVFIKPVDEVGMVVLVCMVMGFSKRVGVSHSVAAGESELSFLLVCVRHYIWCLGVIQATIGSVPGQLRGLGEWLGKKSNHSSRWRLFSR